MNLELVLKSRETLAPVLRGRLERAERASRRLLGLIESMLEFIRIERGALEVRRERVDVADLAREVVEELRPQARSKLLDLRLGQAAEVGTVNTDPRLVRLVMLNLLANAIKFTDRGHVELALHTDNRGLRLIVSDTGRGISESGLQQLFEPFQPFEDLHGKHVVGLGLGLTVVREVVTALGGQVYAKSQLGQGSRFEVWFPGEDETLPSAQGGLFSPSGL
jgi:signal transduction histidine kinase